MKFLFPSCFVYIATDVNESLAIMLALVDCSTQCIGSIVIIIIIIIAI